MDPEEIVKAAKKIFDENEELRRIINHLKSENEQLRVLVGNADNEAIRLREKYANSRAENCRLREKKYSLEKLIELLVQKNIGSEEDFKSFVHTQSLFFRRNAKR